MQLECSFRIQQVIDFITQEYARSALIAYESIPKNVVQEGWGRPSMCLVVYLWPYPYT